MKKGLKKRNTELARGQIFALQDALMALPESLKIKEELHHHFAQGLYAREMRVPAGTVIVGKIHRYPCLNFIMSGVAEVRTSSGASRYKAPHIFESGGGTKRAIFAVTDLTWVTVHPTTETDLEKLEDQLIDDHEAFLHEHGITPDDVERVLALPFIKVDENYELRESPLHGVGVFANMQKGDRLTARLGADKTEVGRFTNHSPFPNVIPKTEGESLFFVATESFDGEVKVNYRHVIAAVRKA